MLCLARCDAIVLYIHRFLFVDFWNRFFSSSYDGTAVQAAEHTGEFDAACRRCADGRGHCAAGSLESIAETLGEPITVQTTLS